MGFYGDRILPWLVDRVMANKDLLGYRTRVVGAARGERRECLVSGLAGTGKTQLVRRLTQLLGFYDRFVEVQMDGFSNGAGWRGAQSISGMLAQSTSESACPARPLLA